jgi:hypothetical protein
MTEHVLPPSEDGQLTVSAAPVPLTVEYAPRRVTMHHVSGDELDTIASLSNSLNLAFFCLCFGAVITFIVVLTTANVTDPRIFAAYVAALIVCSLLALYFGIRGIFDYVAAKKKLNGIKNGK